MAKVMRHMLLKGNLLSDENTDPIDHPFVEVFFNEYDNSGSYSLKQNFN